MTAATGQLCARARFWASLRLDGELSELESALLDAHLAQCAACRETVAGFAGATTALRAEQPAVPAPIRIERARPARRPLVAVVAAAVVVLAALLGGLLSGGAGTRQEASAPRAVAVVASVETADQIRRLRRTTLLNERKIPRDLAEPV